LPKAVQPQVEHTTPKQENEKFNKELLQIWKGGIFNENYSC